MFPITGKCSKSVDMFLTNRQNVDMFLGTNGNDECPVEARSISVFFRCERLIPQREKLEQRKGTGEVTYVTEPVPARSAE